MVLADYLTGNPALGPHPVVMGSDALQWNGIDKDLINDLRAAFGLPAQ